ncbi:MAG TPA: threonine synthase [Longimicrobiales bacterium]|nr:threonine synthase [Longimicrobiales bacterium]
MDRSNAPLPGATHLECTATGEELESERLQGLSPAGKPLFARYDLTSLRDRLAPGDLPGRSADLWRYEEVLPVRERRFQIRLGEGWTPLLDSGPLADELGVDRLLVKNEGRNPTASFKDRGLCLAVSRAKELGATELAIPSAGNAGSAASAYAAAAGLPIHVIVPRDTPAPIVEEISALGADLRLLDGLITDCGRAVREGVEEHGWWDLSTLKEPYRVEGKKTMGYELFEQLGGRLPDAIVYPTGGGTGLIGMWKAFGEMEELGWIGAERPKMFSVQSAGCAPIVRAWEEGAESARPWEDAATYASGLRVPSAIGDFLILRALRESEGGAVAVPDAEMKDGVDAIGRATGVFAAPEGGATAAAVPRLLEMGLLDPSDEVVLFVTGSGLKYVGMNPLD